MRYVSVVSFGQQYPKTMDMAHYMYWHAHCKQSFVMFCFSYISKNEKMSEDRGGLMGNVRTNAATQCKRNPQNSEKKTL